VGANRLEPEPFELMLTLDVIREETADDADCVVGEVEVPSKEADEEPDHSGIRVREA
jgi:hypothetical protein